MTRRRLLFFSILHICIGSAIAIFHGPFYGDAQNFYGYAESIGSVTEFLDWRDITSIQNYNVFFVSLIYDNAFQAAMINIFALFLFVRSSHPMGIALARKQEATGIDMRQYYTIMLFIIVCPSIVVRLGEPSREYLQSLLLFLVGVYFNCGAPRVRWLLPLSMLVLIRPVAAPIYMLWLGFFWVLEKGLLMRVSYFFMLVALLLISGEFQVVQLYSEKSIDYDGVLGTSPDYYQKIVLNVLGDINSFASDQYQVFDRFVFFLDYLWRILFLILLLSRGGRVAFVFVTFATLIISALYPFPHPRYFVPALFFLGGVICSSQLRSRYANATPRFVVSARKTANISNNAATG